MAAFDAEEELLLLLNRSRPHTREWVHEISGSLGVLDFNLYRQGIRDAPADPAPKQEHFFFFLFSFSFLYV